MSPPPLLSLVIPVYNVAPFLPACLDSLMQQTPAVDEIIVVDDGSTDDCPAILNEYAPRIANMRVIRQENMGLSVARNTGLQHATGKYLAFVDSDDFLAPSAYCRALERAEEEGLDMVVFNASFHFEGRKTDQPIYENQPATDVMPGREWLRQRLRLNRMPHMVWMHLYRRQFLCEGGWQFVPGLVHEDVIWTTELLIAARRMAFEPRICYFYRLPIRRLSPEVAQKKIEKIIDSSVFNARSLAKIASSPEIDEELRQLITFQLVDGALSVFHKLDKMPDRDARRASIRRLWADGWFAFLWQNAANFSQRRKIAKRYLSALLA